MKLELLKEKEIPILSRKRYTYVLETDKATPSRLDLLNEVSNQLKVDKKLIAIKHIYPQYGSNKVKLIANVYKKEEDLKKFEHESLIKRHHKKTKAEIEQEEKEKAEKEAEVQRKKEEAEKAKEELHAKAEVNKESAPEEKTEEATGKKATEEVKEKPVAKADEKKSPSKEKGE